MRENSNRSWLGVDLPESSLDLGPRRLRARINLPLVACIEESGTRRKSLPEPDERELIPGEPPLRPRRGAESRPPGGGGHVLDELAYALEPPAPTVALIRQARSFGSLDGLFRRVDGILARAQSPA